MGEEGGVGGFVEGPGAAAGAVGGEFPEGRDGGNVAVGVLAAPGVERVGGRVGEMAGYPVLGVGLGMERMGTSEVDQEVVRSMERAELTMLEGRGPSNWPLGRSWETSPPSM